MVVAVVRVGGGGRLEKDDRGGGGKRLEKEEVDELELRRVLMTLPQPTNDNTPPQVPTTDDSTLPLTNH